MGHWAQNQASAMAIPASDLNPVEKNLDEEMVSDLLSGVL